MKQSLEAKLGAQATLASWVLSELPKGGSKQRETREQEKQACILTSSEFLPVTALCAWDQETTLLWFRSFDLFFWQLEKCYLQARHWRDKEEKFYLHKYAVHVLCWALPVNFRTLFSSHFFLTFRFRAAFLLSFDWSVCSDKVFITNKKESRTDLVHLLLCTCSGSLV